MITWGIDLGGTKIECVVLDVEGVGADCHYNVLSRERIPTEQKGGYRHILLNIKSLIEQVSGELGFDPFRIGFGTPGIVDTKTGLMKNCNTQCLNEKPLFADLKELFGCDIAIANDANCFALAEHWLGAAKGAKSSFGVIMGTGVGGGLVIDAKPWNGAQGIAGEWGHVIAEDGGAPCYCGLRGCVETVISGPALESYYASLSGSSLSLKEIVSAKDEDVHARTTIERLHHFFGKCLAKVVNICDPEVIVLGGGLSNIESLYSDGKTQLAKHVFNNELNTKLAQNALGDSAGVFGAALL